jgi:hypothetical protein
MLYIVFAIGFLALVIAVVKQLHRPEPPYITAYTLVIVTGLSGFVGVTSSLPLLANSTGAAAVVGLLGVLYLAVALWGANILKNHLL